MWWSVFAMVSCGPGSGRIEAASSAARDGDVWIREGPVTVSVIGHAALAPGALFATLEHDEARLVLLAGDAVTRSHHEAWRALRTRVAGLTVLPVVGVGERRRDRGLRGFHATWAGVGVAGLSTHVPWYAVDVTSRGARWRLVVLDSHREGLGPQWQDQLYWVPKVVGDAGYDHLIVALDDGPGRMDGRLPSPSDDASELLAVVRHHADATRLRVVIGAGGDAPAVVLPGGRWGEAWVTAGRPVGPALPLWRRQGSNALPAVVDAALVSAFEARAGGESESLRAALRFEPPIAPVAGYWDVVVDGESVALNLHLADGLTWTPVVCLQWDAGTGWRGRP